MRLAVRAASGLLLLLLIVTPGATLGEGQTPEIEYALQELGVKLAGAVAEANVKSVGVPEFANSVGGIAGRDGAMGRYAADIVQKRLMDAAQGRYEITTCQNLSPVLTQLKIETSGLTEATNLSRLGQIKNLDALVVGQVYPVPGMCVRVSAELVKLPTAGILDQESCDIPWNTDTEAISGRTQGVSSFPCRMEIVVDGKPKQVFAHGGLSYVAADLGKEYSVRLHNNYGKRVGVALLVDGINVLTKKIAAPSQGPLLILENGQTWDVPGYREGDGYARSFKFVEAEGSLARCMYFTEQIGLITASFFPECEQDKGGPDVGTVPGSLVQFPNRPSDVRISRNASAVLSLRYDRPECIPGSGPTGKD